MLFTLSTDSPDAVSPDSYPYLPPSIHPPGFAIVTGISVATTVIAGTVLLRKYGLTKVVEGIPTYACELGAILGGLITFNLAFFLGNVFGCDCSAWAGG